MNKTRKNKRIKTKTNKRTNKRRNKRTKNNKIIRGGADIYSLKGKIICGARFELYFNEVYASSNRYVYSLCKDKKLNDCNETLAKIYELESQSWNKKEDIDKEAEYMKLAFELGVSPEFLGLQYCKYDGKEYAILIIKHYGSGNLTHLLRYDYYEENKDEINSKLKQILDTLYQANISHNDLHSNNFLYRMNEDGDIEFKIIDFDVAEPFEDGDIRKYKIKNLNRFEEDFNGKIVTVRGNDINVAS